jgi:hypothetical protein
MIKPSFLYHASPISDLKVVEPKKNTAPEGFKNGAVVFATDNFAFSTQFLVTHDDSWANGGAFGDIFFFVVSDEKRFRKNDRGGCVYLVPSKYFANYTRHEWFARKSAKVISRVVFSSGLEAMLIAGVQVYFVKPHVYVNIQKSNDHGVNILNALKSENEKKGLKVEKLDLYTGSKKLV